jgi:hypothetical protein
MKSRKSRLKVLIASGGLALGGVSVAWAELIDPWASASATLSNWQNDAEASCDGYGYLYSACMADYWQGGFWAAVEADDQLQDQMSPLGCVGIDYPQPTEACDELARYSIMWNLVANQAHANWGDWALMC